MINRSLHGFTDGTREDASTIYREYLRINSQGVFTQEFQDHTITKHRCEKKHFEFCVEVRQVEDAKNVPSKRLRELTKGFVKNEFTATLISLLCIKITHSISYYMLYRDRLTAKNN